MKSEDEGFSENSSSEPDAALETRGPLCPWDHLTTLYLRQDDFLVFLFPSATG